MDFFTYTDHDLVCATSKDSTYAFGRKYPVSQSESAAQRQFIKQVGLSGDAVLQLHPAHPYRIHIANEATSSTVTANSVIVINPRITVSVLTADCLVVVVYCPKCQIRAVVHIGWFGVVLNHLGRVSRLLDKLHTCSSGELMAYGAPAICPRHYIQTGWRGWIKLLLWRLAKMPILKTEIGSGLDLLGAASIQLRRRGVRNESIHFNTACTFEDINLHSHRREGISRSQSNLTVVGLVKKGSYG